MADKYLDILSSLEENRSTHSKPFLEDSGLRAPEKKTKSNSLRTTLRRSKVFSFYYNLSHPARSTSGTLQSCQICQGPPYSSSGSSGCKTESRSDKASFTGFCKCCSSCDDHRVGVHPPAVVCAGQVVPCRVLGNIIQTWYFVQRYTLQM